MTKEDLIKEIMPYFASFGPHDFNHTYRVYRTAVNLAEKENADMRIVEFSALLHDIGRRREEEDTTLCHAEEGGRMATEILYKKIPAGEIKKIVYCITVHRYRVNIVPTTLEAKILQDADRLDSLGAVVIARTFAQDGMTGKPIYDPKKKPKKKYDGQSETGINHLHEKILKIRPESFHTDAAQEAAKRRYQFVENYVKEFQLEWEGIS